MQKKCTVIFSICLVIMFINTVLRAETKASITIEKSVVQKPTLIESRRCKYDMNRDTMFLEKEVFVDDNGTIITCDKAYIEFESKGGEKQSPAQSKNKDHNEEMNKKVRLIRAEIDVKIVDKDMVGTGRRAVYDLNDKTVTLTGDAKIVKTDKKTGKKSEARGSKIIYHVDSKMVEIINFKGIEEKKKSTR